MNASLILLFGMSKPAYSISNTNGAGTFCIVSMVARRSSSLALYTAWLSSVAHLVELRKLQGE